MIAKNIQVAIGSVLLGLAINVRLHTYWEGVLIAMGIYFIILALIEE